MDSVDWLGKITEKSVLYVRRDTAKVLKGFQDIFKLADEKWGLWETSYWGELELHGVRTMRREAFIVQLIILYLNKLSG